jgi:hypothetical protein
LLGRGVWQLTDSGRPLPRGSPKSCAVDAEAAVLGNYARRNETRERTTDIVRSNLCRLGDVIDRLGAESDRSDDAKASFIAEKTAECGRCHGFSG